MRMVDLIEKKKNGSSLSKKEIDYIIAHFTTGEIPDYQMSALLMAICYEDMTETEITDLTLAMAYSGDVIDLSAIKGIKVDKHSTGGVGDTTTLVLAPLVASLGVPVAKMSGKGLGHTGGTIDKLEAISGFQVELSNEQFIRLVNSYGLAVTSQSGNLAPADKKLYALRDVTATVDSIPLIASSIMSKKIASGADAIVLDVTVGRGAFMKNYDSAERLAKTMVQIGKLVNKKTVAILSDMSQPLGNAIGNSLEIVEAIHALKGEGPADLMELVYALGSQMLLLSKKAVSQKEAKEKLIEALQTGQALAKFREMIQNQGGDTTIVDFPERLLTAKYKIDVPAKRSGYIQSLHADEMGIAAMLLGAGRATKEDIIDYSVGLQLHKKVGQPVVEGESLVTIHSNRQDISDVREKLYQNIIIGDSAKEPDLIYSMITNGGES